MRCYRTLKDAGRLCSSIGPPGGGNHFIGADRDGSGLYYLVAHTGSRNLGRQVAGIYQKLAVKRQSGRAELTEEIMRDIGATVSVVNVIKPVRMQTK